MGNHRKSVSSGKKKFHYYNNLHCAIFILLVMFNIEMMIVAGVVIYIIVFGCVFYVSAWKR